MSFHNAWNMRKLACVAARKQELYRGQSGNSLAEIAACIIPLKDLGPAIAAQTKSYIPVVVVCTSHADKQVDTHCIEAFLSLRVSAKHCHTAATLFFEAIFALSVHGNLDSAVENKSRMTTVAFTRFRNLRSAVALLCL
jgi:hypothetical protein